MICPGCLGCGWRSYFVETVEGEEERAWKLCPECGGGDAFPRRKVRRDGVGVESLKVLRGDCFPGRCD
jgi:uncharacterized protein YbbK (DUF523 family)